MNINFLIHRQRNVGLLIGRALVVLLCSVAIGRTAGAQKLRFVNSAPDCDLSRKAWDSPISDHGGLSLPRYQWHMFNAGLSIATAEALQRTTHLPRFASALTTSLMLGLVPHIRSALLYRSAYPDNAVNTRDWAFDLFNRSAPLLLWWGSRKDGQSKARAVVTEIVGYAGLACYSRP